MKRELDAVLDRLEGVRDSQGSWTALCPAHADTEPSLSISEGDKGIVLNCHAGCAFEEVLRALGLNASDLFYENGTNGRKKIAATYDYTDESGQLLYQVVRFDPKGFRQRRPDGVGGWIWNLKGVGRILYRLPEVAEAVALEKPVYVVEGEKDADRLADLGVPATTAAGGAGKWRDSYSEALSGGRIVIIPDTDDAGQDHASSVAHSLSELAEEVRILRLPDLPPKGDVSDWFNSGGRLEELQRLASEIPVSSEPDGIVVDDFHAYMPTHRYIFVPRRELWPAASVNSRIPPLVVGDGTMKASKWIDRHRSVEQMTWAPGEPLLIQDRLISHGGWIHRAGVACFNLYRPLVILLGDASAVGPWNEHIRLIYPEDADHIIAWLAHRVQHPGEKVNHALVLGGLQGIGKDSLLEPVKHAVGPWNFSEVSPAHLLGRFNSFVKSVILRVNEARDLGDMNRYAFYDHTKVYTASPPDVLRCDEKNIREYAVLNVSRLVVTSNYKSDGIYLPADDRRHYIAWSEKDKGDFDEAYWQELWGWYEEGGMEHVAAYLTSLDLSDFDPKAPPPKTPAFWHIVDANRSPEDAEIADVLDKLDHPDAITLEDLVRESESDLGDWLGERKHRRQIPFRLENAGYVPVRNEAAKDGLWKVSGKRQAIYARHELSVSERASAASTRKEQGRWGRQ